MTGNRRRFLRTGLLLLSATVSLAACGKPPQKGQGPAVQQQSDLASGRPGAGAIAKNRSEISATVLEVVPLKAPHFRLRLRVDRAEAAEGYTGLARAGEEIVAYPNYVRSEGQALDPHSEANQHMADARELQPGDHIVAVVTRSRDSWLILSWGEL